MDVDVGTGTLELPTGTVTFLFTDVEGSTALAAEMGDAKYAAALSDHRDQLTAAIVGHQGVVFGSEGDALFTSFGRASDALAAALEAQRSLFSHRLRARIGVHTGEALMAGGDYVGLTVHQVARVAATGHGGQIVLSESTRQLASRELPDGATLVDLGEHRLKDLAEPQRLFQLSHDDLPSEFPPLRTLELRPHNLPIQLTSFVGRDDDLTELQRLIRVNRLVTLTGVGGCGKTRLALQAGAELLDQFPEGVWIVDLAPVEGGELVAQAAAAALGVNEGSRKVVDAVVEHLSGRRVLLVIDNCEHVASGAADFVEAVLQHCPSVHVLATGREILDITGEVALQVPSLSFPENDVAAAPDDIARHAAVRLFMERALAVDSTFALGPGDAEVVARICRRLDGIPLAIELAAPKIRSFDVSEIERRLDDRFRLLSGGTRRGLGRQQTLRATVDWSHDLLTEDERVLLRRLATFSGGCSLAGAERVCADDVLLLESIVPALEHLVGRSLVAVERAVGGMRYRQLETIRQYGFEKLAEAGEVDTIRAAQLAWCLDLAREAEPELLRSDQKAWLDKLDAEGANLRSALDWAVDHDPHPGLDLAARLGRWWLVRGGLTDGRARLTALLDRVGPDADVGLRARGLVWAQACASYQQDHTASRAFGTEAVAAARAANDQLTLGMALNSLGFGVAMSGDTDQALKHLEEARAILLELDPMTPSLTGVYANTAQVAVAATGDLAAGRKWLEKAVAQGERAGHLAATALATELLAGMLRQMGDHAGAKAQLARALDLARQLGDWRTLAAGLEWNAYAAAEAGDYGVARARLAELEPLVAQLGGSHAVDALIIRAAIELGDGDPATARREADAAVVAARRISDIRSRVGHLDSLAGLLIQHGELTLGRAWAAEALEMAESSPDPLGWIGPAATLAAAELASGDHLEARRRLEAVVEALVEEGASGVALSEAQFRLLHTLVEANEVEAAVAQLDVVTSVFPGDWKLFGEGPVELAAGAVAMIRGDLSGARTHLEACLQEFLASGVSAPLEVYVKGILAEVAVAENEARFAATACRDAVLAAQRGRLPTLLAAAIETTARLVSFRDGDHSRAGRLLGAARAMRLRIGAPIPPRSAKALNAFETTARAELGDEAFDTAVADGTALDQDAAVELAMDTLSR